MKLSKAQEEVINNAKTKIDFARTLNFFDWYMENYAGNYIRNNIHTPEELDAYLENRIGRDNRTMKDLWEEDYQNTRNGIVHCIANSRTLKKLEEMGIIEIVYDSNGDRLGLDTIRIKNY